MKITNTYEAKLYIGLKEGYEGWVRDITEIETVCQQYCNDIGLGVTITPTKFVYTGGNENGAIIGLINYPRFPKEPEEITQHMANIAAILIPKLKQHRATIVCTDKTIMIEKEDIEDGNEKTD